MLSLFVLLLTCSVSAQVDSTASNPECDKAHFTYVFKNFKLLGNECEKQDIILIRANRNEKGERTYRFISQHNNLKYIDQLLDIYNHMSIPCVIEKESFEVVVCSIIDICDFDRSRLEAFMKEHETNAEIIYVNGFSRLISCGFGGHPTIISPEYIGLAPLQSLSAASKKLKIKLPESDVNKVQQQH